MRTHGPRTGSARASGGRDERGSALVLALLVMIIMTLLGLAFALAGEMESRIAVNKRDAEQALYVAEGGVRVVKNWFDAPAGTTSIPVPTSSQIDRSLRYVDDNADGTYGPYSSACTTSSAPCNGPYNVTYRQGTDDLFEKPYRGSPALTFIGTEDHPDLRISETGSSGERAYLASLNASLFPSFPAGVQRARISRIDVYSPPIIVTAGQRQRYGIATIKVIAGIYEHTRNGDGGIRIATRMAKAVLNELPVPGPLGPLQSNINVDFGGNFTVHWGKVTSTLDMILPNNIDHMVPSGVPWHNRSRIIAQDMNLDGSLQTSRTTATPDDINRDGTLDFDSWMASTNFVEDPWLRFWAEGAIRDVSPGCSGPDCQPSPWYQAGAFRDGTTDHSNMFANVSEETFPKFDYSLWKNIAQSGGANVYYYAYAGMGTGPTVGTYKLNGTGPATTFEEATKGRQGLFFFDTATNSEPYDSDGTPGFDNLAPNVVITGRSYGTKGIIFLNANFVTRGGGNPPAMTIYAPGEPFVDANGNGRYDPEEYFLDLTYPNAADSAQYRKNGMRREQGTTFKRKVPAASASVGGRYETGVNVYGVLYTNGTYDATGNFVHYGAVVTKGGMAGSAGTPEIYFDERLVSGGWPPPEIQIPRTMISAWETEN